MRQIILDTETTGLETEKGHRIIEIGCVELIDREVTGNNFHCYINPERKIDAEAIEVHGITDAFLTDKPVFSSIIEDFLSFVCDTEIIAHNASFDVGFINHELKLNDKKAKPIESYAEILDTLTLARKMFPGQRNSLDALCRRYKIDLSNRTLHGALLDAQLLAEAYLMMTGGQRSLFTDDIFAADSTTAKQTSQGTKKARSPLPIILATDDELNAHESTLGIIKKSSGNCLWKDNK